jgi:hypothetical protein
MDEVLNTAGVGRPLIAPLFVGATAIFAMECIPSPVKNAECGLGTALADFAPNQYPKQTLITLSNEFTAQLRARFQAQEMVR